MTNTAKQINLISTRRLTLALIFILLVNLVFAIIANSQKEDNPMESAYSIEIRKEYEKCRELDSPVAQYLCSCRILEQQCEAPRKDIHGNWNTVEYWPSNDPAEREVQFILFMSYDSLGDFRPNGYGVVYTCMGGESELNVFLGNDVDETVSPLIFIGDEEIEGFIFEDQENYMVEFSDTKKIFNTLANSKEISVTFEDFEGNENFLEFDSAGFVNAAKGWERVCESHKPS